jgi:hypothetical protein
MVAASPLVHDRSEALVSAPFPLDLLRQADDALRAFNALELAGRPGSEAAEFALASVRLTHLAHAAFLRATAALDSSGEWERDGAATAAGWLRARAGLAPGSARGHVRDARLLRDALPAMAEALARGEVSPAHIRVLTGVVERYPERRATVAQIETALVEVARDVDAGSFRQVVERWTCAVDPQAAIDDAADRHQARTLSVSRTLDGMVAVDGLLDPENGSALLEALRALTRGDRAEGDDRTPKQRRADALGELARRALDRGDLPTSGGERPHVHVSIPIAVVRDSVADGALLDGNVPLTADAAWQWMCDSAMVPMLEAEPGQVLDVGRSRRTIPLSLRRAVVRRDLHCVFAGCDATADRCEVHHIVAWAHGGTTSLSNLALLCHRHHRAIHQEGFILLGTPDDGLRTLRPDGTRIVDPFATSRRIRHARPPSLASPP